MSIMFSFKNFFRHIHEHCRYLSLFCFNDTFGFLVNGSWSHDKLSAPYFVPCCTENISIIEIDHSLHCSQNSSEKKFQLQPGIIIIAHSQNQTSFFFFFRRNWDSFFLFDMATPPRKKFLIKLTRRNADGQNVHHQRETQTEQLEAVHPCERCRTSLSSCRLPLSVQKQNFSSVVAASGFVWQKIALQKPSGGKFQSRWQTNLSSPSERSASKPRHSFLPVRRPPWLRKHSFSTAQVHVMIGSPSSALSIPEEEDEELFSAMSIDFAWL